MMQDATTGRRAAAVAFAAVAALFTAPGRAETADDPTGRWTTIDDSTHEARAEVEIRDSAGTLSGRIVWLFRKPGEDPAPRCEKCPGERRDRPVIGMTILWGLRRHGAAWSGGEIVDPESGRVYRASIRTVEGGSRLEVRGYVGIPLIGRTQVWERAAAAK